MKENFDENEEVKQIKKLEIEMNLSSRQIINVQIVDTSPKMMISTY